MGNIGFSPNDILPSDGHPSLLTGRRSLAWLVAVTGVTAATACLAAPTPAVAAPSAALPAAPRTAAPTGWALQLMGGTDPSSRPDAEPSWTTTRQDDSPARPAAGISVGASGWGLVASLASAPAAAVAAAAPAKPAQPRPRRHAHAAAQPPTPTPAGEPEASSETDAEPTATDGPPILSAWFQPLQPVPTPTGTSSPTPGGWHGWTSGASGDGVADGEFGAWRGTAIQIAGTWDDGDAASQTDLPTLQGDYTGWTGDIDVAVGGTVLGSGESYAAAAQGAYLARWQTMAQHLAAYQQTRPGALIYVRPWHEFNGDWYHEWQVTPANLADYQAAWRLMVRTIRQACPTCKIVWSPNNGTSAGSASPLDAYPGDDVVDVIGVDTYNANGNTVVVDQQTWQQYATATADGIPVGPEAWRQFAEQHGKPIAFPEWGLNRGGGGGDNPAFIQGMHDWMTAHAAQPGDTSLAGKVVYDVYFNVAQGDNDGFVIKDGPNPVAGTTYRSLRWGTTSTSSSPTIGLTAATAASAAPAAPTAAVRPITAARPATANTSGS